MCRVFFQIVRYFVPLTPGCIALLALLSSDASAADPYVQVRDKLVRKAVIGGGIRDARVVQSMRTTPRHEFMDTANRHLAYYDMAVPIGHGQTISPPYIVAYMTAQLQPKPTDRVLEIGTGSGYQAARSRRCLSPP